jgi:hypothetical protein
MGCVACAFIRTAISLAESEHSHVATLHQRTTIPHSAGWTKLPKAIVFPSLCTKCPALPLEQRAISFERALHPQVTSLPADEVVAESRAHGSFSHTKLSVLTSHRIAPNKPLPHSNCPNYTLYTPALAFLCLLFSLPISLPPSPSSPLPPLHDILSHLSRAMHHYRYSKTVRTFSRNTSLCTISKEARSAHEMIKWIVRYDNDMITMITYNMFKRKILAKSNMLEDAMYRIPLLITSSRRDAEIAGCCCSLGGLKRLCDSGCAHLRYGYGDELADAESRS